MGCASSKEGVSVPAAAGAGQAVNPRSVIKNDVSATVKLEPLSTAASDQRQTAPNPVSSAKPNPQPLYAAPEVPSTGTNGISGKATPSPNSNKAVTADTAASANSPTSTPAANASGPAFAANGRSTTSNASTAANTATQPPSTPAPRIAVRRDRSNLRQRQATARDSDEESDWDQCSTTNFNLDIEDQTKKDPTNEMPAVGSSVMEKAMHNSLYAEQHHNNDEAMYKETSILRIDKVKGCMFVNQYLVVKFLGRGACGKVFLCLNTHDLRLYAMKAVRKVDLESTQPQAPGRRRNPMEDLKREIMIMKKMKHNNIVTLSEVIDDPSGSKLLLVMEFMEGGPVLTREALEKRERLPESLALQYFRDMVKALDYLHGHKVVHGDLKPENVLMAANGDVKLSDFGCSKVFATGNDYLERCNGTPAFLAPEMMKPNTRYRGRPTDVYALGACLYTLIFGRIPFSAPNLYKLFQVVQNEPVKYPDDVPISNPLRDLLNQMLTKNPRERISLTEMMRHPWTTMNGRFTLKPSRELKDGETQEVHDQLKDGITFAQFNPKPDYLQGLANLSRHERTFEEGDVIMRQGDTGTYLMYIVSGTVDMLVKWMMPAVKRNTSSLSHQHSSSHANSHGPRSAPHGAGQRSTGGDEFMDESDTMSPITNEESRQHRINLMRAAAKAREFIRSLQAAAGSNRDLLIAQRGPGELVGEMALFSKSLTRCATVRCATRVTVRIITHEQLVEYLMQQPLAKHQIREGIWKKESEITMVEALVKLANVHDIITASLDGVGPFPH